MKDLRNSRLVIGSVCFLLLLVTLAGCDRGVKQRGELQKQLAAKCEELGAVRQQYSDAVKAGEASRVQLTNISTQVETLGEKLQVIVRENAELRKEVATAEKERNELRQQLTTQATGKSEMRQRIADISPVLDKSEMRQRIADISPVLDDWRRDDFQTDIFATKTRNLEAYLLANRKTLSSEQGGAVQRLSDSCRLLLDGRKRTNEAYKSTMAEHDRVSADVDRMRIDGRPSLDLSRELMAMQMKSTQLLLGALNKRESMMKELDQTFSEVSTNLDTALRLVK